MTRQFEDQWIERGRYRIEFKNVEAARYGGDGCFIVVKVSGEIQGSGRNVSMTDDDLFMTPLIPEVRAFQIFERLIQWMDAHQWDYPPLIHNLTKAFTTPSLRSVVMKGPEPAPRNARK